MKRRRGHTAEQNEHRIHESGSRVTRSQCGFNLVKLLVAIVVLSVVGTMMASIFRHSQAAWKQGTGQDEVEAAGRVALSMLAQDLQDAVADSILTFQIQGPTDAP